MGLHDGHREKLRQRYLNFGLDAFEEHEALELLLFYAIPRRDTNPIAHKLLEHYGSLSAVLSASVGDLKQREGIGENAAILLTLLSKIMQKSRLKDLRTVLRDTERAAAYLLERFAGEEEEVVYQLCLGPRGKLLSCRRLGEGGLASAHLDIRRLLENALMDSAHGVILSHNHPSGQAIPSNEDITATRKVREALKTIGVPLQDHIIVAGGDYISMRENGYLEE